jgi:hypothetical protein
VKSGDHPRGIDREVGPGEAVATRASEARLHARHAADNAACEKQGAEDPSIEDLPGPRMLDAGERSALRQRTNHLEGCNIAEAGGSPSSEAPLVNLLVRSAEAIASAHTPVSLRESGSKQRVLVLEVGCRSR